MPKKLISDDGVHYEIIEGGPRKIAHGNGVVRGWVNCEQLAWACVKQLVEDTGRQNFVIRKRAGTVIESKPFTMPDRFR